MLKQNYRSDNHSQVHLTNSDSVPTFFNSTNTEIDFRNNTHYNERRPSIPSIDYETYFNNPY